MMVTRNMEDFITWVDGSSRKRTIMKYNDEVSRTGFDLVLQVGFGTRADLRISLFRLHFPVGRFRPTITRQPNPEHVYNLYYISSQAVRPSCILLYDEIE
jgi:hypothetical protein